MERKILAFQCPFHGLEYGALCWRAFQEENKDKWLVYVPSEEKVSLGMLRQVLAGSDEVDTPLWLRGRG